MGGLLIKSALLVGVAVVAGYLHSRGWKEMPPLAPGPASPTGTTNTAPPATTGAPVALNPATTAQQPVTPTAPKVEPVNPEPGSPFAGYISVAEAKQIYDTQAAIFVDARTYDEFKKGHVPGALHMDKKYFDGAAGAMKAKHLKGQAVVIYCGGADCTDSDAVAKRLIALKFSIEPIRILKDGLPGWQQAGHPVDVGEEQGFGG